MVFKKINTINCCGERVPVDCSFKIKSVQPLVTLFC